MTTAVFLGTPGAAIPSLAALAESVDIGLVITQPDRPRGRSGQPAPSAVKEFARDAGFRISQPESRDELTTALNQGEGFDFGVVVAYGRILSNEMLTLPTHGLLNVHFSLLPRWRGAAPVARALIAGDAMSGVTIIRLNDGLDTGPVLTAQGIDIEQSDDAGTLTERLANIGARLLVSTLPGYLDGTVIPIEQSDDGVAYAHKITSDDRPLDLEKTAIECVNQVRGLAPAPAATLVLDGETHKIIRAAPHPHRPEGGTWEAVEGRPVVSASDMGVELISMQPPGRRAQSGSEWLRGARRTSGHLGQGSV